MTETLRDLDSIGDLANAIAESHERPVIVFKHSTTCPISVKAFREFESFLKSASPAAAYNLITIQRSRDVSNEAAARLNVPHESPQAILLRNGQSVWDASHFEITQASLSRALLEVS